MDDIWSGLMIGGGIVLAMFVLAFTWQLARRSYYWAAAKTMGWSEHELEGEMMNGSNHHHGSESTSSGTYDNSLGTGLSVEQKRRFPRSCSPFFPECKRRF